MKQWEQDAIWGSDILGNGACFGDLTGQVKTRQIGFIRNDSGKDSKNVSRKVRVPDKGRSQTNAARPKQGKR